MVYLRKSLQGAVPPLRRNSHPTLYTWQCFILSRTQTKTSTARFAYNKLGATCPQKFHISRPNPLTLCDISLILPLNGSIVRVAI
jgi:hypothetical protein